jgi:DNA processing protein
MEDAEVVATLALSLVPGVGTQTLRKLVGKYGSADAALGSGTVSGAARAEGERVRAELDRLGARVVFPGDPAFPALLEEIYDPPALLYVWGDVSLLSQPTVAIVGSRDHTAYGAEAARLLAGGVAKQGAVVVSGMARGIDAIAHTAALDVGGGTIGVLGNGFGVIYPAANRTLYERMIAQGCLVTEYPPGERPHAGSFSRRNRLISGIARATLVIEAAHKSGALVTVNDAIDQNRDVLAVPGPITSPTSVGCNTLLHQGAKIALSAGDVLEAIGLPRGLDELRTALATPAPRVPPVDLSGLQLALWTRMTAEPQHVDALVAAAHTRPAEVLGALTDLELRGLVRQCPGMVFALS